MALPIALILAALLHALSVPVSHATNPLSFVPCAGLAGCDRPPFDGVSAVLFFLAARLLEATTAFSVLYVVWAGVRMLLANGDEGVETKARWGIAYALGGMALSLAAGTIVSLVTSETFFGGGDILVGNGSLVATAIRLVIILFNSAFAVVIVIAGVRMLLAAGNSGEFGKGVTILRMAIVGAIIVNLAKVIVQTFLSLPHGLS